MSLASTEVAARPAVVASPGWMFSPGVDLAFVAVGWWVVLVAVLAYFGQGHEVANRLTLVDLLLLNLPHRWLTFVLVFLDRERYATRPLQFNGILAGLIAFAGASWLFTGAFDLPALIVLVWTKWHFAAQHHGVLRVYARLAGRQQSEDAIWVEKWLLRGVLMYGLLRVAEVGEGAHPALRAISGIMPVTDFVAFAAIGLLIAKEIGAGVGPQQVGRFVYLSSALSLYGVLIGASALGLTSVAYAAAFTTAVFHSVEYLAISAWSIGAKRNPRGIWVWIVPRSGLMVFAFVVFNYVTSLAGPAVGDSAWVFINIVVTLCHFVYDGMIWKKPATAARAS